REALLQRLDDALPNRTELQLEVVGDGQIGPVGADLARLVRQSARFLEKLDQRRMQIDLDQPARGRFRAARPFVARRMRGRAPCAVFSRNLVIAAPALVDRLS